MSAPVLVIVDGSNVARCSAWRAANEDVAGRDDDLRLRLVDAVCGWAARVEVQVQLVFDGAGPWRAGKLRASEAVQVIGSGRADGDAVLERRAAIAHRAGRTFWVATSDRALQQVAGARAERILDADAFVAELGPTRAAEPPASDVQVVVEPGTRLAETLDADVRARLERMRRGELGG